jgi:hypothetical protein
MDGKIFVHVRNAARGFKLKRGAVAMISSTAAAPAGSALIVSGKISADEALEDPLLKRIKASSPRGVEYERSHSKAGPALIPAEVGGRERSD